MDADCSSKNIRYESISAFRVLNKSRLACGFPKLTIGYLYGFGTLLAFWWLTINSLSSPFKTVRDIKLMFNSYTLRGNLYLRVVGIK